MRVHAPYSSSKALHPKTRNRKKWKIDFDAATKQLLNYEYCARNMCVLFCSVLLCEKKRRIESESDSESESELCRVEYSRDLICRGVLCLNPRPTPPLSSV